MVRYFHGTWGMGRTLDFGGSLMASSVARRFSDVASRMVSVISFVPSDCMAAVAAGGWDHMGLRQRGPNQ